jgi:hypothetical protein
MTCANARADTLARPPAPGAACSAFDMCDALFRRARIPLILVVLLPMFLSG